MHPTSAPQAQRSTTSPSTPLPALREALERSELVQPCAAANPAIASWLQSNAPVGRVAELGSLGGSVELLCMSYIYHIPMLPAAIPVIAFVIGMAGPAASADETGAESRFEEHPVEFHNQDVKLAGSLLLPRSEVPVPAVVFVHGAGRQTREPYREAG